MDFEETSIWKRTLAPQGEGDVHAKQRERLRRAYLSMRENVTHVVAAIHHDCKGLTVHDVTHLDALWQMADVIVGTDYEVGPAEAFVLGCSILLHDAGTAVVAYPRGLVDIRSTDVWRDNLYSCAAAAAAGSTAQTIEVLLSAPTEDVLNAALFSTLRDLHAEQAEHLALQEWDSSIGPLRLISDDGLRSAYGSSIGRIAHSHHWGVDRLAIEFQKACGAEVGLPPSWSLNEIKVAGILRCADIAHIDERRAPHFLKSLLRPSGISGEHWTFQSKINQATTQDDSLVYTSGSAFQRSEAPAWWRAYDAVVAIQKEIEATNGLLADFSMPEFAVRSVKGTGSPKSLSRYIRTDGWEPVNAEVVASDPARLAKTLGGRNLYGNSPMPAVRELLQNAIDAIRARRKVDERDDKWGRISLTVEKDELGNVWLHVDDTGVGMSQRVLTGPLIDFGNSIWRSSLLREEFPGLAASSMRPIGKFGIGFFSVFVLGDKVRVASKRFDYGDDKIAVLEFDGLGSRPLVRKGSRSDLPRDFSTRVSVMLADTLEATKVFEEPAIEPPRAMRSGPRRNLVGLEDAVLSMIAPLDIDVDYSDRINVSGFAHSANWTKLPADKFLSELYAPDDEGITEVYAELLRDITDDNGDIVGRAALSVQSDSFVAQRLARISIGGLTTRGEDIGPFRMVGVLPGDTNDVSRSTGRSTISTEAVTRWAKGQIEILSEGQTSKLAMLQLGQACFARGIFDLELPVCFMRGEILTAAALLETLAGLDELWLPARRLDYSENIELDGIKDITWLAASGPYDPRVLYFPATEIRLFSRDKESLPKKGDVFEIDPERVESGMVTVLLRFIRETWKSDLRISFEHREIVPGIKWGVPHVRTVLKVTKAQTNLNPSAA